MPTILDAGSTPLSNADVLHWIRTKRTQIAEEDREAKSSGQPRISRPQNYMNALRRHETELSDEKYAYLSNPGAYDGTNRNKAIKTFVERYDEEICYPLEQQYRNKKLDLKQLKATLGEAHKKKTLTTSELLMIHNLTPENVSILEMVIESHQDRFTPEEMQKIVDITAATFKCGDKS